MPERAREREPDPAAAAVPRRARKDTGLARASARVLALQRMAGNQAVRSLLEARGAGNQLQRAGSDPAVPPGLKCEPANDSPPIATELMLFLNAVSALTPEQRGVVDNIVTNWNAGGDQPPVRVDGYASSPGEDDYN